MPDCQLCSPPTTVIYHDGERVRVVECDTCERPVISLSTHASDPDLALESYALGVARGLFGSGAGFVEAGHGVPVGHWSRHVRVPTG